MTCGHDDSSINMRSLSKIANFSHPRVFSVPLKEFPLELGTDAGVIKLD